MKVKTYFFVLILPFFALSAKEYLKEPQKFSKKFSQELNLEVEAKFEFYTLKIENAPVGKYWRVLLNQKVLGWVEEKSEKTELLVPVKELQSEKRELVIQLHTSGKDKIELKSLKLEPGISDSLKNYAHLIVSARDYLTQQPTFARFSLIEEGGKKAEFKGYSGKDYVLRKGLAYFDGHLLTLLIKPGKYSAYMSRGMEYGVAKKEFSVKSGETVSWNAVVKKELDLGDYLSADTHIHTFTYSGHGKAAIEERELSFLGEDLDIAIMTDHNHNTTVKDHMHYHQTFSIDGNEVTTNIGHINIFPVSLQKPIVNPKLKSWQLLREAIDDHGAKYSILNHPRWPKLRGLPHGPFDKFGFDRSTATFRGEVQFPFDAMEVVNSDTKNSDKEPQPLVVFKDWLALRKAGMNIAAVGSSDSHTIETPMGQGRTYLRLDGELNEDNVVEAFQKGRLIVSLGLFAELIVDGKYQVGDEIPFKKGKSHRLEMKLMAPSWVKARSLHLYSGDEEIKTWKVDYDDEERLMMTMTCDYTPKSKDDFLVLVALGKPIHEDFWHAHYEASISITNPIMFK